MNGSAMSATQPSRYAFSSVAPRWILANVLPSALLVAAGWAYLGVSGVSLAGWINGGADPPRLVWSAIAMGALYLVASVWLRGAVLRPLVPRFTILGWVPTALLSGVVMLALTAAGSFVGLAVAKGLAVTNADAVTVPTGLKLIPFVLGIILGTEILGLILGGLPGLIISAGEALVVGRAARSVWNWILWAAAAWSTVTTLVMLHAFLVVFDRSVPAGVLSALAVSAPIFLGLAAALVTLPAVARLARRRNGVS
jgi:hypothetical protein